MSRSPSIERPAWAASRRRVVLALVAVLTPLALAGCGKKGTLRLPRPGEMEDDPELDEEDPA